MADSEEPPPAEESPTADQEQPSGDVATSPSGDGGVGTPGEPPDVAEPADVEPAGEAVEDSGASPPEAAATVETGGSDDAGSPAVAEESVGETSPAQEEGAEVVSDPSQPSGDLPGSPLPVSDAAEAAPEPTGSDEVEVETTPPEEASTDAALEPTGSDGAEVKTTPPEEGSTEAAPGPTGSDEAEVKTTPPEEGSTEAAPGPTGSDGAEVETTPPEEASTESASAKSGEVVEATGSATKDAISKSGSVSAVAEAEVSVAKSEPVPGEEPTAVEDEAAAADSPLDEVKTSGSGVQPQAVKTEAAEPSVVEGVADTSDAIVLNTDGLLATPSTSLPPSASEAARPPVPPPSGVDVTDEPTIDSKTGLYWERQLAELKEKEDAEDSVPVPGDSDSRPDRLGFRAPEEYARRASEVPDPSDLHPTVPVDRRGVGAYPVYAAPLFDDAVTGSDTPRGPRPYPLYDPPEGVAGAAASSVSADGGDWADPAEPREQSGGSGPLTPSMAGSAAGEGDAAASETSGEGREKPVLPPDHPLMARFQLALERLLRRRTTQLDLDLVELHKEQRATAKQRESLGVQLYERQLQLSRQQQQQQQLVQQLQQAADTRRAAEETLLEVRAFHQENRTRLEADRVREKQLRMDVGNLEKHEYHLKSLENDADTELQLRQKMAERADAEMDKLEQDKQRQDYLIARLGGDAERLRTAIRLHNVQTRAQAEEFNLARQVLAEAQLELDTLEMEKRHLQQTWTNSLNTMQKRDEEYSRVQNNISKMSADLHTVDGEIAGYIRSLAAAQDENEQLLMQAQRLRSERDKFQRNYDRCMQEFDVQKEEYAHFRHILNDTEDKLYQMQLEQKAVERKLKHIVTDMERVTDQKRLVEEQIVETMQERLTSDSAGRYTAKVVRKTRGVTKIMEAQVADVENSIARLLLAVSNASTAMEFIRTVVEQLLEEVRIAGETLNRYQMEIHRGNAIIQHKQNKVQELNTKLGILIAAAGGQELGPLEIMIASLHKGIDLLQAEVDTVQQYYIRLQNNLVCSTQERDALAHIVMTRKKELLIMDQRKMRVERSIETEAASLHAVELGVKQLRQAVCHLNERLAGETQLHRKLAANTSVMEYELCHALREVEAECVGMRTEISDKDRQRAQMLCRMAEAGETELLWEQKIALLKQAKDKLKGETGCAAEVQSMRLEIHRMQVRYGQLLREQERLMTEMERAVDRRETIALRAEHSDRRGTRQQAANFFQRQKKLEDLKRRFKAARRDASHLCSELGRAERQLQLLTDEGLPQRRQAGEALALALQQLQLKLCQAARRRAQNLARIVLKQQSSKFYQSLMEGHYTPLIRSLTRLDSEVDSTDEKHKSVRMLVRQLLRDRPELSPQLQFLRDLLKL